MRIGQQMDTRPRVLFVEDDQPYRDTWIAVLTREGFKVDGAGSSAEAKAAADRCSYHVAVVDIMLAGDDRSNVDGVEIVRYLRWLREDTQPLVLSAQKDTTLVRDLLRDYGAIDYLSKKDLKETGKGNALLLNKIRQYLPAPNALPGVFGWETVIGTLAPDRSEGAFVSDCLQSLTFKGGFENLRDSLLMACKHLSPLMPRVTEPVGIVRARVPGALSGLFWSKGQSTAVEILIHGKNASDELLQAEWKLVEQTTLYNRTRAGLTVVVLARPDLRRDLFISSLA